MSLQNLVGRRVRNGDICGEIYEIVKSGGRIVATVLTDGGELVGWDAKTVIFEMKDKQRECDRKYIETKYIETPEKMLLG